jgi:hypothetical protein
MTDTQKNVTGMLGAWLVAAILTIGGISMASSKPAASIATPIDVPVLSADGGMPAPPPITLPGSGGTKRA